MELAFRKFLFNDEMIDNELFSGCYSYNSENVYEVVRVIDSVILFWDEHYKRLVNSISLLFNRELDLRKLLDKVKLVIRENEIVNGNVRIEFVRRGGFFDVYVYPIKFYYPDFNCGVSVVTYEIERKNPTVKSYDYDFRRRAEEVINERNVYEVLLVNRHGFITEGSRTNTYFIKDGVFFTAPSELVLSGVTRANVNRIINDLGFCLLEECVHVSDIGKFDACFLTSTSSNVLPVDMINDMRFDSSANSYLREVSSQFQKKLKDI